MSRIVTSRVVCEKGSGIQLMMMIGEQHYIIIKSLLAHEKQLAFHAFAFLFESSHAHGESGVHRHIVGMDVGDEGIPYRAEPDKKIYPILVTVNLSLESYERLRRTGRKGKSTYPDYQIVEG